MRTPAKAGEVAANWSVVQLEGSPTPWKETFLLLCQQLLWYRYREPQWRRAEIAACALRLVRLESVHSASNTSQRGHTSETKAINTNNNLCENDKQHVWSDDEND